jgi:hypothetical protein
VVGLGLASFGASGVTGVVVKPGVIVEPDDRSHGAAAFGVG